MKNRKSTAALVLLAVAILPAAAGNADDLDTRYRLDTEMTAMQLSGEHGFRVVCENAPGRVLLIQKDDDAFVARTSIDRENMKAGRRCWASWLGLFRPIQNLPSE